MIDELMQQYGEKFGDLFPLMCCMDMTEDEIAERIRECIRDNRPFEPLEGPDY